MILYFLVGYLLALGKKYTTYSNRFVIFDLECDDRSDNLYYSYYMYKGQSWSFFFNSIGDYRVTLFQAREAAYESALIVHKILQNKPVFMLNDEIYYNKMKSFTLQILHRKNTFNFNGLGLFQLDYTFIFSVLLFSLIR